MLLKVIQELDVCGLCRGPAHSLVQSAAHPSPLHLLPYANRLHCTTADLSHTLHEPIERHVHTGSDQPCGVTDLTLCPVA